MEAKIVLARPIYAENIGLVARAMANFGFSELALVKPLCDWKSPGAKSRAMHGKGILLGAKEFGCIGEAASDCAHVVATTAKAGGEKIGRTAVTARQLAVKFAGSKKKIAIVFGNEPDGLSNTEIAECDFVATIPCKSGYNTLNLSHAAAIFLYELQAAGKEKALFKEAGAGQKKLLLKKLAETLKAMDGIDNKEAVGASFRALLGRSLISEKEACAIAAFLNEARKGLRKSSAKKA